MIAASARSCRYGHPQRLRSNGQWRCLTCENAAQTARRRAARTAGRPPPPPPDDVEIVDEQEIRAPAVHTSRTRGESYLVIPDTQSPYEAEGALSFVMAVAKEFSIDVSTPGRVYHVGDEADFYAWSRFPASPERAHTPTQELDALRGRLRPWYAALPFVRVCHSNHGGRVIKAAANAQLPQQVLRAHREILDAPIGWQWQDTWRVDASRTPFLVEHGHAGPQSAGAVRQRPALNGISTVWGHLHAQPTIAHVQTLGQRVWGFCVGSLIDRAAVAFEYGRNSTWQPVNGCGVVLDGGRMPVWIPYGGQWP